MILLQYSIVVGIIHISTVFIKKETITNTGLHCCVSVNAVLINYTNTSLYLLKYYIIFLFSIVVTVM